MNSPLTAALREAASAPLPPGAFLRRHRGGALFVTDAPRRAPEGDWCAALAAAGFVGRIENGLLLLSPGPAWLMRLESQWPEPPDFLCASLARFRHLPPEPESLALFALGAAALEDPSLPPRFDRQLRRRAAVCLRLNRTHPQDPPRGGGLFACALLDHELEVWTT